MSEPLWDDYPHVIRMQQFPRKSLELIVDHAQSFAKALTNVQELPRYSKRHPWRVCPLFYEPSTRTSITFENAAIHLGCSVQSVNDPGIFSSAVKGESFPEAIAAFTCTGGRGASQICDVVILRHPQAGASREAVKVIETAKRQQELTLPLAVINAGDGTGQHPTQAFVDLTTIFKERKVTGHPLNDVTILFPGDLKRSRVVNSLLYALGKFGDICTIKTIFACPESFRPKPELLQYLAQNGVTVEFATPRDFRRLIPLADIIYITRIQRERADSEHGIYKTKWRKQTVFRAEYAKLLKTNAIVMHPLPINRDQDDPPAEIDQDLISQAQANDPRFVWMRQSHCGLEVRLALIDLILCAFDQAMEKYFPDATEVRGHPWPPSK